MNRLSFRTLCQAYTMVLLLLITILSSPPYLIIALIMLTAILFSALRPLPPGYNLVISIAAIFLTPLVLSPVFRQLIPLPATAIEILSAFSVLPIVCLLDNYLRQNAPGASVVPAKPGKRRVTGTYRSLLAALLPLLVAAVLLANRVLLATDILFSFYLLAVTMIIFFTVPRAPLVPTDTWHRIIAGTTANVNLSVAGKTSARIYCTLRSAADWIKVIPESFILDGKRTTTLNLNITPPLAGPSHPEFSVAVMDARGLVQLNQIIEPVELHVIPRAKYAEWLARKYLEQTGTGDASADSLPEQAALLRGGIEYQGSRDYQPGDPLQRIDWKHTSKLHHLIIREFAEAGEPSAIIAVNLAVTSDEEADKLASNLITAALTLAREHIPAAMTAYNRQEVLLTTAVTAPDEILKRALALTKDVMISEMPRQYLAAPDIARLRNNIHQLQKLESEPAQKLMEMLNFEQRALEDASRNHPATTALMQATKQVAAPAVILLVSPLNHDIEAVLVNSEKLSRARYTVIPLGIEESNG